MALSAPSAHSARAFVVARSAHAFVAAETFSALNPMTTVVEPIMSAIEPMMTMTTV